MTVAPVPGFAKTAPAEDLVLDLDAAIERMGDREVYLEIARYFAGHVQSSLESLLRALDTGNAADATRLAHSLKGNCATVGAESLRERCYTLEKLCRQEDLETAKLCYAELVPRLLALRDILLKL